jgi:hypothetical protein
VFFLVVIAVVVVVALLLFRRQKSHLSNSSSNPVEMGLKKSDKYQSSPSTEGAYLKSFIDDEPVDPTITLDYKGEIGTGNFGAVYLAVWKGQNVAVKTLKDASAFDTFFKEMQILGQLDHPNIIK